MKNLNLLIICLCFTATHQVFSQGQDVNWINLINTQATGNVLTKTTGGYSWNAGARSSSTLFTSQNGWVETNATQDTPFMIGLADTDPNASYESIDYAIYVYGGIYIRESGTQKFSYSGTMNPSDRIRVEKSGTTIDYKVNNVTFYTSTIPATTDLFVDVSFYSVNSSITGTQIHFGGTPPTAPSNLFISSIFSSQITLSWNDNSSDETGFQIERSLTSGTGFSLVSTTSANATSFTDTGLQPLTQYYYRIRAMSGGGVSTYTSEVSATTLGEAVWLKDGTSIFYNEGDVGINTTSPSYKLDVNGTINATSILVSGQPIQTGPSSQWTTATANIYFNTGSVGIGTDNPQNELDVNGTIHAKEVKVDLNGWPAPDYVFEKDYPLTSLSELKTYIEQNKHLPEIPSAKEMEANGVNLKEMNLLLLKKVEELTLYILEQETRIKNLESKQH